MGLDLNTEDMERALAELARHLSDLTPVMEDIGELMVASTRQNFVDATGPDGTPWAPKSQTTLDAYRARGDSAPTKPLTGPSRVLGTSSIFAQPDAEGVSWGSSAIQAAVMQFGAEKGAFGTTSGGGSIPWGDIPARPFIGVGEDDESAITATIAHYLEDAT